MTMYNQMGDFDEAKQKISEWSMKPVSKNEIQPMEAIKNIHGYAIEQHQWEHYHHFLQEAENPEQKELFANISFQEEEHQSMMGSLFDPDMKKIESAIAVEMAAIQGFCDAAQLEPNNDCKTIYDYALLDHLTQLKNIADSASEIGIEPDDVLKGHLDVIEGRPTQKQLVPTSDLLKTPIDKNIADATTFVNLHGLLAAEMSLRNGFHAMRPLVSMQNMRVLLNTVTAVENEHIAMIESCLDPDITPLEYLIMNELVELRVHKLGSQFAQSESAKSAHEYCLEEDREHLQWLLDAYQKHENGDPTKFQETDKLYAMPEMSAMDYIDQTLETEIDMRPKGMGFEKAA